MSRIITNNLTIYLLYSFALALSFYFDNTFLEKIHAKNHYPQLYQTTSNALAYLCLTFLGIYTVYVITIYTKAITVNKEIIIIITCLLSAFLIKLVLKNIVFIQRPNTDLSVSITSSFPSGHTALAAMVCIICIHSNITFLNHLNAYVGIVIVILMACLRIGSHQHYVIDVTSSFIIVNEIYRFLSRFVC